MAILSFDVIKLKFTSPLHLSRGQTEFYDKSETILHSDTIKSALFSCAKILYKDEINKEFLESFSISSAFPFQGKNLFFPKPIREMPINILDIKGVAKKNKKMKKVEFVSKCFFEEIINSDKIIDVSESNFSGNGKFLSKEDKEIIIYKSEVQQRLTMPENEETNPVPYYVDRLFFNKNAGLYFLINVKNEKTKTIIINSLKLLSEQGIGTDRNIGNGQFEYDWETGFKLNVPDNAKYQMSISLFLPCEHEITNDLLKNSRYQLFKRGGYISSPENLELLTFRKKSVYMFQEGSVFPNSKLKGKIVDLKPDNIRGLNHEIWRDGTAIFIPLKLFKNDKS